MPREPTDGELLAAITLHVQKLEQHALDRSQPDRRHDAIRSLAVMAVLAEGWWPGGGDDGEVIDVGGVVDLSAYRLALVGKAA